MACGDVNDDHYLAVTNRRKLKEIIRAYNNPKTTPVVADSAENSQDVSIENDPLKLKKKDLQAKLDEQTRLDWDKYYQKYFQNHKKVTNFATKLRGSKDFIELVHRGIPHGYRVILWTYLLGLTPEYITENDVLNYEAIKAKSRDFAKMEDIFQIDKDVQRTFRDRPDFKEDYSVRQCMLFNVLVAYSFYNYELGYCQGMSACAGFLLLYLDECQSFYGLHRLMTQKEFALQGMFLVGFPKYMRLRDVFERYIREKHKQLFAHLESYDTIPDTYLMQWLLTLFQAQLPLDLSLRIWDIFLLHGDSVLLPMAYTLLTYPKNKQDLKRSENPKTVMTDFKKSLEYEASDIIKHFKNVYPNVKRETYMTVTIPEGEIPDRGDMDARWKRDDLESNGFSAPDLEETEQSKETENAQLIKRAQRDSYFARSHKFFIYSTEEDDSQGISRPRLFSDSSSNVSESFQREVQAETSTNMTRTEIKLSSPEPEVFDDTDSSSNPIQIMSSTQEKSELGPNGEPELNIDKRPSPSGSGSSVRSKIPRSKYQPGAIASLAKGKNKSPSPNSIKVSPRGTQSSVKTESPGSTNHNGSEAGIKIITHSEKSVSKVGGSFVLKERKSIVDVSSSPETPHASIRFQEQKDLNVSKSPLSNGSLSPVYKDNNNFKHIHSLPPSGNSERPVSIGGAVSNKSSSVRTPMKARPTSQPNHLSATRMSNSPILINDMHKARANKSISPSARTHRLETNTNSFIKLSDRGRKNVRSPTGVQYNGQNQLINASTDYASRGRLRNSIGLKYETEFPAENPSATQVQSPSKHSSKESLGSNQASLNRYDSSALLSNSSQRSINSSSPSSSFRDVSTHL